MVNFTILAGGFSTFIATYIFDTDASSLLLTKQSPTGENPSWIASNPRNSTILYAVNENTIGKIQSFLVDNDGGLTLVDTVSSGGSGPAFTNQLSTGEVTAMNFGSADCSFMATTPDDPLHLQQNSSVVKLPVDGGPSNPHMSLEYNGEIFVSDLGADKVWRLVNDDASGKFKVQGQIDVVPGNGPRHMAIRDGILFIVNELTSTLTAQQIPTAPNGTTLPLIANVSIVPSDVNLNGTFRGAEILISEPSNLFLDPLIYVSNRNLGPEFDPRGDSIAIFEFKNATETASPFGSDIPDTISSSSSSPASTTNRIRRHQQLHAKRFKNKGLAGRSTAADSGALVLQNQVFTGLRQIRSMAIGRVSDGGEKFLIAGANLDGGVVVFNRTDGGRNLTEVARNQDIANRTSFVFV